MKISPQLKIAQKVPLVVLGAALVVGSAIAGASYYFAAEALENQARQNLATIAFERANQLSAYISAVQADVARVAKSETAIQGLHAFATAWPQIKDADPSTALRQAFITDNPNAESERLLLDRSATPMNYNTPHSRYQPIFREQLTTAGYRDLYLFDRDGNLVYTTVKGDDYAMPFAEGASEYANSALGTLVRKTMAEGQTGVVEFADFSHYAAIPESPVAFFAAPVDSGTSRMGVLAVAITAEKLSDMISYRTGLGETGDTMVVAIDGTARSNSPMTPEDDVLQPTIFDPMIRDAVTGVPGETASESFRGRPVLASAAPVDVTHNQSWALVSVMATSEIFAPITRLGTVIFAIGAGLLFAAAVAGWLFSRTITRPVTRLTRAMGELADGNLEVEIREAGRGDELGAMARSVEVFRENAMRVRQLTEEERMNAEFRTAERIETMQALQRAFGQVVDAAVAGDFTKRVSLGFDDAELNSLGTSVNNLVETVERNLGETGHVLAAIANADLTLRMHGEFQGAFGELRDDLNTVGERLTATVSSLRGASRSLKSATGEILAGAANLSERTTSQGETIDQTSAAIEQLTTTVVDNARRAAEASAKAQSVSDTATEGGDVMRLANDAMERITASSGKISNIIGLIDDIAFQTNLLALNASVEAARAGEAGRGFAVVAVEVRRLAQSAAQASNEVKALIDQSGTEVRAGSKLVSEAAGKLLNMLVAAKESSELIEAIARASREQASGIEEVSSAVRKLDTITQHNAALVEETNAALEKTEAQATELDRIVESFTLERRAPAPTSRVA